MNFYLVSSPVSLTGLWLPYLESLFWCSDVYTHKNTKQINTVVLNRVYTHVFGLVCMKRAKEMKKPASICCCHPVFKLVPVHRRLGHVSAMHVHVNRAANLYLCRAGCLSILACLQNHSASDSLIYTHSHLGADHSEHQFSTVGLWKALLESF